MGLYGSIFGVYVNFYIQCHIQCQHKRTKIEHAFHWFKNWLPSQFTDCQSVFDVRGQFTYYWKGEQLFGFKFDRLVKNWPSSQKLTVWSKIDRLVKNWSLGKNWSFGQNTPFSFRSVLLSFRSLFVLFSFCSFDVCVCVVWCGYDKGPRYIIPRPRPRPDPEGPTPKGQARLLWVPILLLIPAIFRLFACHLAVFHCVRNPVSFKLAPMFHAGSISFKTSWACSRASCSVSIS